MRKKSNKPFEWIFLFNRKMQIVQSLAIPTWSTCERPACRRTIHRRKASVLLTLKTPRQCKQTVSLKKPVRIPPRMVRRRYSQQRVSRWPAFESYRLTTCDLTTIRYCVDCWNVRDDLSLISAFSRMWFASFDCSWCLSSSINMRHYLVWFVLRRPCPVNGTLKSEN